MCGMWLLFLCMSCKETGYTVRPLNEEINNCIGKKEIGGRT